MSPHRRFSPLSAAMQATTAAGLPALVSASSSRSRSKHRHTHLHKDHHASSNSDSDGDSTEVHNHHEHTHSHSHYHSHDNTQDSIDELRRRDDSSAAVVTQVVQTVSVVQVIDGQGSIVTLSTAYTPSATQAEADLSAAGTTADSSDATQTGTTATATAAAGATGSGSTGSTSTAALTSGTTALTSGAASVTAAGSAFANGTATAISVPLTTGPSTTATLTGNSSSTHLFGNSTSSTFHSLFANRTHTSSVSSSFASSSSYLSSSSVSSSGYSSSLYSSATGSSSAYGSEATGGGDGAGGAAGGDGATGSGAGATPTSTTTNDGTSSSTPTSVLVGSVIGGLAGLAVLLVIALYLLKMKKKKDQSSHRLLTDSGDPAPGGAHSIPSGPSGPGAPALGGLGLGMSEARTGFLAPFASALASGQKRMSRGRGLPALTAPSASDAKVNTNAGAYSGSPSGSAGSPGVNTRLIGGGLAAAAVASAKNGNGSPTSPQSPFSPQSASSDSPTTERSFYRVSGRKLPSVLQHGGDGYDDPRQSVMSTNTVNTSYTANAGHMSMYRDSRGFFGGAGGPATTPASRYALGTPMRPESGVPVFHSGPGKLVSPLRAPVSRQGSFIQDDGASARNLTPPAAPSSGAAAGYFDPVGRSLISQDGSRDSRGSVSRFTEDIL